MSVNKASFYFVLLFLVISCSVVEENDIYGVWIMDAIVYDDGVVNKLDDGNYVEIDSEYITEVIYGYGKRRYLYRQDEDKILLDPGSNEVIWTIAKKTANELQLATPIGQYILVKEMGRK